jgi:hypothetical protein
MFGGNLDVLTTNSNFLEGNLVFFSKSNKLDQLFTECDYTNIFPNSTYFNNEVSNTFDFSSLTSDIERLSNSKNDVDLLCQVFPSYEDIICELDI